MFKNILFAVIMILPVCSFAVVSGGYEIIVESGTPKTLAVIKANANKEKVAKLPIGKVIEWTALQLMGKPYSIALLDQKTPEYLYISLNNTDCMLFIEEVVAVSELIKNNRLDMNDLTTQIAKLRYHGDLAYCNRNHYFKDWAYVNEKNGIFKDEAFLLTGINLPYKANVMSIHIANAAESNPHKADLACIKAREDIINNQESIGFIPLKDLPKYLSKIQSGDVIGIIRHSENSKADSVHHLGIAYVHNGVVSMIHASSEMHKVVISDTLTGYLARFKDSQGIVLLRAK